MNFQPKTRCFNLEFILACSKFKHIVFVHEPAVTDISHEHELEDFMHEYIKQKDISDGVYKCSCIVIEQIRNAKWLSCNFQSVEFEKISDLPKWFDYDKIKRGKQ